MPGALAAVAQSRGHAVDGQVDGAARALVPVAGAVAAFVYYLYMPLRAHRTDLQRQIEDRDQRAKRAGRSPEQQRADAGGQGGDMIAPGLPQFPAKALLFLHACPLVAGWVTGPPWAGAEKIL